MSQIIQSSALNPAALQADELYIQIVNPPVFLTGTPSDVCGIVGTSSWGPLNTPLLLGSTTDMVRSFGGITSAAVTGGPSGGIDTHDLCTDVSLAFAQAQSQASLQIWGIRVSDGTDTKASVVLNTSSASAGITFTSLYSGILGNQIQVVIAPGILSNTYNVSIIGFLGLFNELFANISAPTSGSLNFWANLSNAVINGISGVRGPSQLITASNAATAVGSQPATGTFSLSGGTDGRSSITSSNLMGNTNSLPYTGLWALRNLIPDVGIVWIAGMTDSTQYSTMQTFADQEGCLVLMTFPTGTTSTAAVSAKLALGISDYEVVFIKDWCYFFDPVNNVLRLNAPYPWYGGRVATLRPEISPSNKRVFNINGTERNNPITGTIPYSIAEVGQLESNGITFITNPIPQGNTFGIREGVNSSSNPVISPVEYSRMTNFLAHSFAGFMGKFVGYNQSSQSNDPTRAAVRLTVNSFLQLLVSNGQIDSYKVICDLSNNSLSTIAQHFLYATVLVKYLASIKFFILSLQGGTTVVTTSNNLNTNLQQ
jgi:uncharacterized protein